MFVVQLQHVWVAGRRGGHGRRQACFDKTSYSMLEYQPFRHRANDRIPLGEAGL